MSIQKTPHIIVLNILILPVLVIWRSCPANSCHIYKVQYWIHTFIFKLCYNVYYIELKMLANAIPLFLCI